MPHGRILVADDDPLITEDLAGRLQFLHYEVAGTATCGEQTTRLAEQLRPDLVLLDIVMPGAVDGIQAAERLRSCRIPFVFVTGYSEGPWVERAMGAEPYGYLHKPYETHTLQAAIQVGITRHRVEQETERQLQEAQTALANLKKLSGLLSICSYCKSIKEGEATWTRIEPFIMNRADITFSHGICPTCLTRVKRSLEATERSGFGPNSIILG